MVLATRNAHKVREIQAILGRRFQYHTLADFADAPRVVEDAPTFEGNARKKAEAVARWLATVPDAGWLAGARVFVLADDSGLEVDALGGAPGVYSARFAALDTGAPGNSGDAENNAKLLALLADVPGPRRTARFRCVLALTEVTASGAGATKLFEGVCEGRLGLAPQGRAGFGYDPLFFPTGSERSFAQLGQAEKNEISHRARALAGLRHFLQVPPPPHRPPGRPGWPRRKGGVSRRTA